jgi:hypothetical protein
MRTPAFILTVILLIICTSAVQARIIHVPGDSTTIQGGINGAVGGDTVMVHPGTYYEHDIDFYDKGITVMGTDPEDSTTVAATIVDGDTSHARVFSFLNGEDSTNVLSGLTITNGQAYYGGGIAVSNNSSPTISYCIFTENTAFVDGGGIWCNMNSVPQIENCIFSYNNAYNGGGVACEDSSSPIITNCKFVENSAHVNGGGISLYAWSSPIIENNGILENSATYGGGIYCNDYSDATIKNNIVSGNTANLGGGIYSFYSSPSIINNTIVEGSASEQGGGIVCTESSSMTVINTILWGNTAPTGNEIWIGDNYLPSNLTISYSDIEGGSHQYVLIRSAPSIGSQE